MVWQWLLDVDDSDDDVNSDTYVMMTMMTVAWWQKVTRPQWNDDRATTTTRLWKYNSGGEPQRWCPGNWSQTSSCSQSAGLRQRLFRFIDASVSIVGDGVDLSTIHVFPISNFGHLVLRSAYTVPYLNWCTQLMYCTPTKKHYNLFCYHVGQSQRWHNAGYPPTGKCTLEA